jgi:AcrR family transcriptional regulator
LRKGSRIGERIQQEQQLSAEAIEWIVCIAAAIVQAFGAEPKQSMSGIAQRARVSRTTLYQHLRLAIEALNWVYQSKQHLNHLLSQVQRYKEQCLEAKQKAKQAQQTIQQYWLLLSNYKIQGEKLEAQIVQMQRQQQMNLERLIVVLRLSGRCSIGSIREVLSEAMGVKVSHGYVSDILAQARRQAKVAMATLSKVLPFSGIMAIDEVFLREWGKRIYGIVVVDPMTGLILRLERVEARTQEAIGAVIKRVSESGLNPSVRLCLTDMYAAYQELVATHFPQAAHQFCWFHINCFHLGAMVRQAQSGYRQAQKQLDALERKHPRLRSKALKRKQAALAQTREQSHRFWVGAQKFQRLLKNCVDARAPQTAMRTFERLMRLGKDHPNPYISEMTAFLERHRPGLLSFFSCIQQQPLNHSQADAPRWLPFSDPAAIPKTTNAAEHIFRCLRRYLHGMDHVGTSNTTQEFFDLFAFFHNVRPLRTGSKAGTSLLAAAGVKVESIFGSGDPYTILGFPPTFNTVVPLRKYKKVSSHFQNQQAA